MVKTHGDLIGSFPKEISTPTQAQFFSIMEEQEETLYFIGMTYYQMEGTSSTGRGDGAMIGPTSGNWNYFESSLLLKCLYLAKDLFTGIGMIDSCIDSILSLN